MRASEPKPSWPSSGRSPLAEFFRGIHPIPESALEYIDENCMPVSVKKGNFLLHPDITEKNLYLLLQGVVRGYLLEHGKEITTWINEEGELVGSIRSLGLDLPSAEYIEAIEDSKLVGIAYSKIELLYQKFPEANIVGRKILEVSYRDAEERAYICRIPTAEMKYVRFMETKGDLLNRIPLKYVASYLGMTLETLSRIRSRMR